jgi:hypothetical protein
MDTLERSRNEKKIVALLHGADDMIEASVAAEWLREGIDNQFRAQVVRTGMVMAYARIFARNAYYRLDRATYRPADAVLGDLHDRLIWWRNKLYAHTDKQSHRTASITPRTATLGRIIQWSRRDFPMAQLAEALALFDVQRKRFEDEAESLRLTLDRLASAS